MSELGLADAIAELRKEIGAAMEAGRGEALKFALGPVELELEVQLAQKAGAKGGLKWVVVSLGAEASSTETSKHKVRLTLTPQLKGQHDILINDDETRKPD